MISDVDMYLADGCGRCQLFRTPQCKVKTWPEELRQLRRIVLECNLTEELKWKVPCYTFEGKNILIVSAFKDFCSLNLFKGTLLGDLEGILVSPGENSQSASARYIKFRSVQEILKLENVIKACIAEAIAVEKAGLKVKLKTISEHAVPEEFQNTLNTFPALETAEA